MSITSSQSLLKLISIQLDGVIDSMDMSLSKLWETLKDREVTHAAVLVVVKGKTLLSNYTATKNIRKQAVL